jgi:hypothetical protein
MCYLKNKIEIFIFGFAPNKNFLKNFLVFGNLEILFFPVEPRVEPLLNLTYFKIKKNKISYYLIYSLEDN